MHNKTNKSLKSYALNLIISQISMTYSLELPPFFFLTPVKNKTICRCVSEGEVFRRALYICEMFKSHHGDTHLWTLTLKPKKPFKLQLHKWVFPICSEKMDTHSVVGKNCPHISVPHRDTETFISSCQ